MSAAIQGIYIALFGRPADPGGLAYWTEVTKNGADLSEMLRVLPSLPEYTSRFEGMDNDQVVTSIYQALFGRTPDAEGLAFFVDQLTSGAQTFATIAVNILQGAQGSDQADIEAKVEAAELFTAALDTDEEIAAYNADAIEQVRAYLNGIDANNPATQESADQAALDLLNPDEGQTPGGGGGGGGTPAVDTEFVLTTGDDDFVGKGGNDTFTASTTGSLQTADNLDGGAGNDVLNIAAGALVNGATPVIKNIETINNVLASGGTPVNLSLAHVSGAKEIWTDASKVTSTTRMNYIDADLNAVYGVRGWKNSAGENELDVSIYGKASSLAGTNTTLKVKLEGTEAGDFVHVVSRVDGVEHVTVEIADGGATLGLGGNAFGLESITITGAGDLTLSPKIGSASNALTLLDARAATGDITWLQDKSVTTGNLNISGGSGNDTFSGGIGNDIINGGAGNDIIWGDNPNNIDRNPSLYGDDTIDGGAGTNIIVLGTKNDNIKLGGQDTVVHNVSDGATNVIFNFNFGPVSRFDKITTPTATDVDKASSGADLTFDIVNFVNVSGPVKISVGQADSVYEGLVGSVVSGASFSDFHFTAAGNSVYTGNTAALELVVEINGSKMVFAHAFGKWEVGGMLNKLNPGSPIDIGAATDADIFTLLNSALGDDADVNTGLVEITNPDHVEALVGYLEDLGSFVGL